MVTPRDFRVKITDVDANFTFSQSNYVTACQRSVVSCFMYSCTNSCVIVQVHGTQHCGPCPAMGSVGSTCHAHEAQFGAANPGPQHHWCVGRDA